jgi:hypothetical protein
MGEKIIVQGGTFYNDAVLRCFELISGREAVRPDVAGLMGAYGCALIAKHRYSEDKKTSLLSLDDASMITTNIVKARCGRCANNCLLTINKFSNGKSFITGNRCEKGEGGIKSDKKSDVPNLFAYKYKRLFDYEPISADKARGTIGIPRVLNMYENFPF